MPERTIVAGLPWLCSSYETDVSEWWSLDVEGVIVYVTNRGAGWRVAERAGIISYDLNDGAPFASREAAMEAGARVARVRAIQHAEQAQTAVARTLQTLRDLVVPLG